MLQLLDGRCPDEGLQSSAHELVKPCHNIWSGAGMPKGQLLFTDACTDRLHPLQPLDGGTLSARHTSSTTSGQMSSGGLCGMRACMHTWGGQQADGTTWSPSPTPSSSSCEAACHGRATRYVSCRGHHASPSSIQLIRTVLTGCLRSRAARFSQSKQHLQLLMTHQLWCSAV